MSFEGYFQILCKNGHEFSQDVYEIYGEDPKESTCPICGETGAWSNLVDLTNGSWEEDGTRIDGYIELEIDKPCAKCTCDKCGKEHIASETTYKIPREESPRIHSWG